MQFVFYITFLIIRRKFLPHFDNSRCVRQHRTGLIMLTFDSDCYIINTMAKQKIQP